MISLKARMVIYGKLDEYDKAVARAETGAVRGAVNKIRTQGRRQIQRAGLGRMAKAWRGIVAGPRGENLTRRGDAVDPRGRVYSAAGVKGRVNDLLDVFERGEIVVPKQGKYLAIPTPAAGGRRALPASKHPPGTFHFVAVGAGGKRHRGGGRRYVLVHKERNEVWYILVPQVKLKKRLNLRRLVLRVGSTVIADLDKRWAREVKKLEGGTTGRGGGH